jgi:hypothetical protein
MDVYSTNMDVFCLFAVSLLPRCCLVAVLSSSLLFFSPRCCSSSNPKLRTTDVCGTGSALKLRFDPPSLRHTPVLPFDDPNKQLVEVRVVVVLGGIGWWWYCDSIKTFRVTDFTEMASDKYHST